MAGPPNVAGPEKNFPPFPSVDGPDDASYIPSVGHTDG